MTTVCLFDELPQKPRKRAPKRKFTESQTSLFEEMVDETAEHNASIVRFQPTVEDMQEIIKIATARHTTNEANGAREQKTVPRHGQVVCTDGMVGEWSLYKLFKLDTAPLYDTSTRSHRTDKTKDANIKGKIIEIKTTVSHQNGIRVPLREVKKPADFYALVTAKRVDKDAFYTPDEKIDCIFHGFVPAATLLVKANIRTWHDGKQYYCLRNTAFRPWNVVCPDDS